MKKPKFSHVVYGALRDAGMSNREIARELGVNEASVRRGLKDVAPGVRDPFTGLDSWPTARPHAVLTVETPEGTFVTDMRGRRLLKVPSYQTELADMGRALKTLVRGLM